MWFKVVMGIWLHVSIADVDHDGVYTQLLMSEEYPRPYAISMPTDKPIDFKLNEWFYAKIWMECSEVHTLHNDEGKPRIGDWGEPGKAYICNAEAMQTLKGNYYLSDKRKEFYGRESNKSGRPEKAEERK